MSLKGSAVLISPGLWTHKSLSWLAAALKGVLLVEATSSNSYRRLCNWWRNKLFQPHAVKFMSCSLRQVCFMRNSYMIRMNSVLLLSLSLSLSCQILPLFSGLSDHSSTRIVISHPSTLLCSKSLGAALSMAISGNANACAADV